MVSAFTCRNVMEAVIKDSSRRWGPAQCILEHRKPGVDSNYPVSEEHFVLLKFSFRQL